MKKTLLSLILLTSWAADVLMVFSLHTQSYPPLRHHHHVSRSRIANSDRSVPLVDDMASILQPRTISPRDSSCDSSTDFSKPLLIGVVAGIFGTLFIQGFVLVLFRIYHKNQQLKAHPHQHLQHHQYQHGQIPIPSAPMDFRHLEHIAMSHQAASSPVGSTASLLRIAHRRADGSWAFTDAMDASDGRSEISSISPYASPLPTPLSHRFPPSPRGTPSVPHSVSVGPRQSMDTITTSPGGGGGGGYEKSVYSVNTQVANHQQHHSPMPSLSRSAFSSSYSPHTSTIYPPPPQSPTASVSPSMSMSVSVMSGPPPMPSSKQQYHIQNLPPPSSAPPPLPLPPLPTPTSSMRSENVDPVIPAETSISSSTSRMENSSLSPSRAESSPSRTRIEDDVGSTRTGPPPYAAYIPTWREQQQMQNMPPLPLPLPFPPPEKGRHRN